MHALVREIIERSSLEGKFNRKFFIDEQCKTRPDDRFIFRRSPEIMKAFFGVHLPDNFYTDYYCWDTTTLAMAEPLLDLVQKGQEVLEIGCGPCATLSLFLATQGNYNQTCVDINSEFLTSATNVSNYNKVKIDFIQSDLVSNLSSKKFDVVFMNPPYLPTASLESLSINKGASELIPGDGGIDGTKILNQLLSSVPSILKPSGKLIIGINTRHLKDEIIVNKIQDFGRWKCKKYYSEKDAQPMGPYAQVYVLEL
jgi:methylase of polypeptide subunit release factors